MFSFFSVYMPPAVSVVTIYCGSWSFTFQYTNHAFKLSESGSSSQLKKYCRLFLDLCVKILSMGDCWSDLCEKRPGVPQAGRSWSQLTPKQLM